ncbi:hypothetical protein [Pontivivens nitratireducens]|nr:hypothetical protein [Pontibrevibacter nitratireducens]
MQEIWSDLRRAEGLIVWSALILFSVGFWFGIISLTVRLILAD